MRPEKVSDTKSAKHPKGRFGFWCRTPFPDADTFSRTTPEFSFDRALVVVQAHPVGCCRRIVAEMPEPLNRLLALLDLLSALPYSYSWRVLVLI